MRSFVKVATSQTSRNAISSKKLTNLVHAFYARPVLICLSVLHVLYCLSRIICPVFPDGCPGCHVLEILFQHCFPDKLSLEVFSCLSSSNLPRSAYLFCMSRSACPVLLSRSACPVLPVPFCLARSAWPVLTVPFYMSRSAWPF
jgi:hypothetical protein